jgi:hypothetical protein
MRAKRKHYLCEVKILNNTKFAGTPTFKFSITRKKLQIELKSILVKLMS